VPGIGGQDQVGRGIGIAGDALYAAHGHNVANPTHWGVLVRGNEVLPLLLAHLQKSLRFPRQLGVVYGFQGVKQGGMGTWLHNRQFAPYLQLQILGVLCGNRVLEVWL